MSQQIYDTKNFPFANIDLGKPYNLNGMYFIKMFVKDSPIYVQPPKCFIKQGILKSGKKWFCDLVFSIEDGYFLTWLEQIEEIAKQKIFENRTNWFETELDEHDIENSLMSPYKMFRSGKMFIIRANLSSALDKCDLKIYDESENEIQPEDVKEETEVITIIELKGIKCSARNFQFVFDVRQMLLVSPVKIFEKCIIKKNTVSSSPIPDRYVESDASTDNYSIIKDKRANPQIEEQTSIKIMNNVSSKRNDVPNTNTYDNESVSTYPIITSDHTEDSLHNNNNNVKNDTDEEERVHSITENSDLNESTTTYGVSDQPEDTVTQSLSNSIVSNHYGLSKPEIYEFEIDLEDLEKNDAFHLKPRNDVYYKLYKEAKQKAKEAKLLALSNYLEAKRLKTTYLLEDSSDSSDEEDPEDL